METAGRHQVDLFILLLSWSIESPQFDGNVYSLGSGFLIGGSGLGGLGGVAKCVAKVDCTIDMRCCSWAAVVLSAVFMLLTCVDLLYFCISAATCCDTSVEICLDLVDLPGTWGFLTYEGLCASSLVTTHSIHGVVLALVSCIHDVYGIVSVPLFCQCLASNCLRQL